MKSERQTKEINNYTGNCVCKFGYKSGWKMQC